MTDVEFAINSHKEKMAEIRSNLEDNKTNYEQLFNVITDHNDILYLSTPLSITPLNKIERIESQFYESFIGRGKIVIVAILRSKNTSTLESESGEVTLVEFETTAQTAELHKAMNRLSNIMSKNMKKDDL